MVVRTRAAAAGLSRRSGSAHDGQRLSRGLTRMGRKHATQKASCNNRINIHGVEVPHGAMDDSMR
jgi:hypothetical protein